MPSHWLQLQGLHGCIGTLSDCKSSDCKNKNSHEYRTQGYTSSCQRRQQQLNSEFMCERRRSDLEINEITNKDLCHIELDCIFFFVEAMHLDRLVLCRGIHYVPNQYSNYIFLRPNKQIFRRPVAHLHIGNNFSYLSTYKTKVQLFCSLEIIQLRHCTRSKTFDFFFFFLFNLPGIQSPFSHSLRWVGKNTLCLQQVKEM